MQEFPLMTTKELFEKYGNVTDATKEEKLAIARQWAKQDNRAYGAAIENTVTGEIKLYDSIKQAQNYMSNYAYFQMHKNEKFMTLWIKEDYEALKNGLN